MRTMLVDKTSKFITTQYDRANLLFSLFQQQVGIYEQ